MADEIRQLQFREVRRDIKQRLEEVQQHRHEMALLLDGVTDMRNVGSIFRLADAARIEKIYLYRCDIDPSHKKLIRTARSTVQYVPYQVVQDLNTIEKLKEKYELVALEMTNSSMPYTAFQPQKKVLLVVGSEQNGVSKALLQRADVCMHLPMYGVKTSMNVLCATGIAVYHLLQFVDKEAGG